MTHRIGPYEISFDLTRSVREAALGKGWFAYPRVINNGKDVTAEALAEVFEGQYRTHFEGMDLAKAEEHALKRLGPVLEAWMEAEQ